MADFAAVIAHRVEKAMWVKFHILWKFGVVNCSSWKDTLKFSSLLCCCSSVAVNWYYVTNLLAYYWDITSLDDFVVRKNAFCLQHPGTGSYSLNNGNIHSHMLNFASLIELGPKPEHSALVIKWVIMCPFVCNYPWYHINQLCISALAMATAFRLCQSAAGEGLR